jgi:signal peptidase I
MKESMFLICPRQEFYDLYKSLLDKAESFRIQVKGGSMFPFIRSGDWIELFPIKEISNVKKGDIILFVKEGCFYVHRLIRKKGGFFVTKGDFSSYEDGNITEKDILAKVLYVQRNNSKLCLDSQLNRAISLIIANCGFFIQLGVVFLRKAESLALRFISFIQACRLYRCVIKVFVNENVLIRQMNLEDKEQLRDLYLVSMPDIMDGILNFDKDGFWLIAERKNKIVGAMTISKHEKGRKLWLIFGLVVKPLFRGKGIGEKLVKEAIKKAKDSGALRIGLFVNTGSKAAVNLYKKAGFKADDEFSQEFKTADNELFLLLDV